MELGPCPGEAATATVAMATAVFSPAQVASSHKNPVGKVRGRTFAAQKLRADQSEESEPADQLETERRGLQGGAAIRCTRKIFFFFSVKTRKHI